MGENSLTKSWNVAMCMMAEENENGCIAKTTNVVVQSSEKIDENLRTGHIACYGCKFWTDPKRRGAEWL